MTPNERKAVDDLLFSMRMVPPDKEGYNAPIESGKKVVTAIPGPRPERPFTPMLKDKWVKGK